MLTVGVHENVQFNKATKNDKGTLVVGFKKQEKDKIAAMSAGRFEPEEQDILIFPPQLTEFSGETSTAKQMMTKISDITGPLEHIAGQFMTKDKIHWELFAGTGITNDNFNTLIVQQDVVTKIYNNIVAQFNAMMAPFTNTSKLFRVVFIRTSKAKHYPKLRTRYLDSQPFMEPMDTPVAKVKFSKYEIDKGLSDPTPAGGAQTPDKADTEEAESLFSNTVVES